MDTFIIIHHVSFCLKHTIQYGLLIYLTNTLIKYYIFS